MKGKQTEFHITLNQALFNPLKYTPGSPLTQLHAAGLDFKNSSIFLEDLELPRMPGAPEAISNTFSKRWELTLCSSWIWCFPGTFSSAGIISSLY